MTRGNGGQPLLTKAADWLAITDIIAQVKRTSDCRLYAYCLMTNHIHLLIRIGAVPLSKIMQRIKTRWSKRFNLERGRRGHVFQGRFLSRACDDDEYLKWLQRYIHINPVKAGLVTRPEDWVWSSYRAFLGMDDTGLAETVWPLSLFADDRLRAVEAFRDFVMQGIHDDTEPLAMIEGRAPNPPVERAVPTGTRPALEALVTLSADATRVTPSAIIGATRARQICLARRDFTRRAVSAGHSLAEVARALGLSPGAVTRMLRHSPEGIGGSIWRTSSKSTSKSTSDSPQAATADGVALSELDVGDSPIELFEDMHRQT